MGHNILSIFMLSLIHIFSILRALGIAFLRLMVISSCIAPLGYLGDKREREWLVVGKLHCAFALAICVGYIRGYFLSRSRAAASVSGLLIRYPCILSQPYFSRYCLCLSYSTPSAMTSWPNLWAMAIISLVIASSSLSSRSLSMKYLSRCV